MRKLLMSGVAVLGLCGVAWGEGHAFESRALADNCSEKPIKKENLSVGRILCLHYVRGYADGMIAQGIFSKDDKPCMDRNLTTDDLIEIFQLSWRTHPERHAWSAAEFLGVSFAEALCKGEKS
jgi:hypothetical protein